HYGPTNLPPSGDDGTIAVLGLHPKRVSKFTFRRSGYTTVYAAYSRGMLTLAESTNPAVPAPLFVFQGPVSAAAKTNNVFIVDMPRARVRPEWRLVKGT